MKKRKFFNLNVMFKRNVLKAFLLLLLLVNAFTDAKAQSWSFDGHAGASVYGFTDVNHAFTDSKKRFGFELGAGVRYNIKDGFFLQSGLDLLKSGGEVGDVDVHRLSLSIPLTVGYNFRINDKLSLEPRIGMYGGYALKAVPDYKRFDFGIKGSVDFNIGEHFYVYLGVERGLVKQSSIYGGKSTVLGLGVGYRW